MKKADLLLKKLFEYGIEDYGCFGESISLFANDPKWDTLPEFARAEILELLDQQFEDMQE